MRPAALRRRRRRRAAPAAVAVPDAVPDAVLHRTTPEWRRERRAAVRQHHPDRGGDPAELARALAEVDRRHRPASAPMSRAAGRGRHRSRRLRRVRRQTRLRVRRLRSRLPRGWPGSRRYIDL